MERKCVVCGNMVVVDKDNSYKAIQYKKKFYHCDCFERLCDQRSTHGNKAIAEVWIDNKLHINDLIAMTTKAQQMLVHKDVFNRWLMSQYNLSFMNRTMYAKLNSVYTGELPGLAYPIDPLELHNEWQYYWDELCTIRQSKDIVGEAAINYDLAIVLRRNAEYRSVKEKEKLAQELRKQQMETEFFTNVSSQIKPKKQPKAKIADLYQEMNGGEGNE